MGKTLSWEERCHYRDRLREARYHALADAEGFGEVCFALEDIGLRLLGKEGHLGSYREGVSDLAKDSDVLSHVVPMFPVLFAGFPSLYKTVHNARNDAMHSGVYARHATDAAIALCIALEEALMIEQHIERVTVGDFMVRSAVIVQPWHPVAYARQLILTNSFSFLPVKLGTDWLLLPEVSVAKFLHRKEKRKELLAKQIIDVGGLKKDGAALELIAAQVVSEVSMVGDLLAGADTSSRTLWLVEDGHGGLAGVLSPFELM
jgi:hypothetical protein